MEEIQIKAADGLVLSAAVASVEEPKALVQIIHGAVEHKERYYDFMEFLKEQGLASIASDNRGHGQSVNEEYPLGYMDGYEKMVEDQMLVTHYIKSRYPGKELYMLGHSFGSLLARCYLQEHDEEIKKLVLSGTVYYIPIIYLGLVLGKVITAIEGKRGVNKLLNSMGSNGTDDTWVSANQANLEAYRKDPLCQYPYCNEAIMTLFQSVFDLHRCRKYRFRNQELKILSISGIEDPVTGGEKGLTDTVRTLGKIGYCHIVSKVYRGMKHEVLNECEHMEVYRDVASFYLNE